MKSTVSGPPEVRFATKMKLPPYEFSCTKFDPRESFTDNTRGVDASATRATTTSPEATLEVNARLRVQECMERQPVLIPMLSCTNEESAEAYRPMLSCGRYPINATATSKASRVREVTILRFPDFSKRI